MEEKTGKCINKIYDAVELFAGIGGIRFGVQKAFKDRIRFVWANDLDKHACQTYMANFGRDSIICEDISVLNEENGAQIPQHDILLAGFPCQPFSIAGEKKGFEDKTRGTLFYNIAKVLKQRETPAFLLENVGYFPNHNRGKTWAVVRKVLENELDYKVIAGKLNAKDFGLPQNRPRFFIAGFKNKDAQFRFPKPTGKTPRLSTILEHDVDEKYYLSQKYLNGLKKHRARHESKGHGFGYKVLDRERGLAQALVVGGMGKERNLIPDKPLLNCWRKGDPDLMKRNNEGLRKVTPRECARLQGFDDTFKIVVSNTQAYRQFANSVPVLVISEIAKEMLKTLDKLYCS